MNTDILNNIESKKEVNIGYTEDSKNITVK